MRGRAERRTRAFSASIPPYQTEDEAPKHKKLRAEPLQSN